MRGFAWRGLRDRVNPTRRKWGHLLHYRYEQPPIVSVNSLFEYFMKFVIFKIIEKNQSGDRLGLSESLSLQTLARGIGR